MIIFPNFKLRDINPQPLPGKQGGFSLVELMVVIVLALFVIAGIFTVFVSSKRLTAETLVASEQLENGAFSMQILSRDLKQSYFFAQTTGENKDLWNNIPTITNNNDCLDSKSAGSFPGANGYRALWASTVSSALGTFKMSCISDDDADTELINGSDYISIKRARGLNEDSTSSADYDAERYYLETDIAGINVYLGGTASAATTAWEYIHHVYYLDEKDNIPRLRRLSLQKNKMLLDDDVLAEGIENMKFMFALDDLPVADRDQSVHAFVNSANVTDNDWNTGRVIGMKIFLLVRSPKETAGYTNKEIYQLGDTTLPAFDDAFKRKVISRILMFPNRAR